eukprot:g26818.t1
MRSPVFCSLAALKLWDSWPKTEENRWGRSNHTDSSSPSRRAVQAAQGLSEWIPITDAQTFFLQRWKDWLTIFALLLVILVALSPIALYEGFQCWVLVISYLCSIAWVKVFVKEAIDGGFPCPDAITAMHMMGVCLVTLLHELSHQRGPGGWTEALAVLPISVLHGASLIANNSALVHGGVAFVSMVGANIPFIIFILELCRGKSANDFLCTVSVLLVCAGSISCVSGEMTSLSAVLGSIRFVWQHDLVKISLAPMRMVFWNGFWTLLITIPMTLGVLGEWWRAVNQLGSLFEASRSVKISLMMSVLMATVLNISQWLALKRLGALLQSIIGNLSLGEDEQSRNLILVIALSQFYLHERVTNSQYLGVMLLGLGTFMNKARDLAQKPELEVLSSKPLTPRPM